MCDTEHMFDCPAPKEQNNELDLTQTTDFLLKNLGSAHDGQHKSLVAKKFYNPEKKSDQLDLLTQLAQEAAAEHVNSFKAVRNCKAMQSGTVETRYNVYLRDPKNSYVITSCTLYALQITFILRTGTQKHYVISSLYVICMYVIASFHCTQCNRNNVLSYGSVLCHHRCQLSLLQQP